MSVNNITDSLKPYPMEELAVMRSTLLASGKEIYDFGTGDPKIPLWPKINEIIKESLPDISQYPSVRGSVELDEAHAQYLQQRFGLEVGGNLQALPTRGSKEAIFHTALSLVGRMGKKTVVFPEPGYPVYRASTLFAGGRPHGVVLNEHENYLLKPWDLPAEVQRDCCAIWVNYPHNPTGALANDDYWQQLLDWAKSRDVVILSDDCYVDIFHSSLEGKPDKQPKIPLQFSNQNILSFLSLSKRSGLTGYRAGMIAGDPALLKPMTRARANMGLGQPIFIQAAAAEAWKDSAHVAERRKIFSERMNIAIPILKKLGWLSKEPEATFYIWADIRCTGMTDIEVMRELSMRGVIVTPGSWLGNRDASHIRFALVPGELDTLKAFNIIEQFAREKA